MKQKLVSRKRKEIKGDRKQWSPQQVNKEYNIQTKENIWFQLYCLSLDRLYLSPSLSLSLYLCLYLCTCIRSEVPSALVWDARGNTRHGTDIREGAVHAACQLTGRPCCYFSALSPQLSALRPFRVPRQTETPRGSDLPGCVSHNRWWFGALYFLYKMFITQDICMTTSKKYIQICNHLYNHLYNQISNHVLELAEIHANRSQTASKRQIDKYYIHNKINWVLLQHVILLYMQTTNDWLFIWFYLIFIRTWSIERFLNLWAGRISGWSGWSSFRRWSVRNNGLPLPKPISPQAFALEN